MKKIGITLIALPFAALFAVICQKQGVVVALKVFGLTSLILIVVSIGVALAFTDKDDLLEIWDYWKWEWRNGRKLGETPRKGRKD